jgi:molybdopterin-binding protein
MEARVESGFRAHPISWSANLFAQTWDQGKVIEMTGTRGNLMTPREASRMLGISYPTIKNWILAGKVKTIRTPGGHHRLTESSLRPFIRKDRQKQGSESRERFRRVSGRNQLAGKVVSVRIDGLLAEVILSIGDAQITAIITANAVRELNLKKGDTAAALIKSTDVMIERLDDQN